MFNSSTPPPPPGRYPTFTLHFTSSHAHLEMYEMNILKSTGYSLQEIGSPVEKAPQWEGARKCMLMIDFMQVLF